MAAVFVVNTEILASSRLRRPPPQSVCELTANRRRCSKHVALASTPRSCRNCTRTAANTRGGTATTEQFVGLSMSLFCRAHTRDRPRSCTQWRRSALPSRETRMSQLAEGCMARNVALVWWRFVGRAHWTMNTKVSSSLPSKLRLLNQAPNPSIERTHNGGAQCPAPSRAVPPLCAAHVKR